MSRAVGVMGEVSAWQSHREAEDTRSLAKHNWARRGISSPMPTSILCDLSCKPGTLEQKSNFQKHKSHLEKRKLFFKALCLR